MYKCILFLGLGGAGQRHLRILRERLPNARMIGVRKTGKTPLLNSDFTVNNGATLESEYDIEFFKQNPYIAHMIHGVGNEKDFWRIWTNLH